MGEPAKNPAAKSAPTLTNWDRDRVEKARKDDPSTAVSHEEVMARLEARKRAAHE